MLGDAAAAAAAAALGLGPELDWGRGEEEDLRIGFGLRGVEGGEFAIVASQYYY